MTVFMKLAVAVSGLLLAGWSVLHLAGTLGVFAGPEAMNGYARLLRRVPVLLWAMRLGLVVLVGIHVALTVRLIQRSAAARGQRYRMRAHATRTLSSRAMRVTGPLLGCWLVYHVGHMYGWLHPDYVPGDVHHNLVKGLSEVTSNASYVAAALLFSFHLHHGFTSALVSLGLPARARRFISPALGSLLLLLALGFVLPSLAVGLGWFGP